MKKKVLAPEALAALATTLPLTDGQDVGDVGATAGAEGTEAAASDNTGGTDDQVDTDEETFSAEDKAAFEGQIEALTTDKTTLEAKVVELTGKVEALEAAALTTDAKIKAASEEAGEYKTIVLNQIAAMRVALSVAAVDMTNWSAEAILREHAATTKSFHEAYAEGSRVPEASQTQAKAAGAISTSQEAGQFRSLGF